MNYQDIGSAIAEAMESVGTYSAQAAAQANSVSRQAQSAQASFNYDAMNTANSITDNRILSQYGYNSAMMSAANNYNTEQWQRAADWNEAMWEKQAEFNAEQARIQRNWQEDMRNTQYQAAMKDMQKAGLNPILAYSQGGAGVPGGAAASVGGAQMSSAQSAQTSGGLVGADMASINNYSGQMEYMSGLLGLLSAFFSAQSSGEQVYNMFIEGAKEFSDKSGLTKENQKTYQDTVDLQKDEGSILDNIGKWVSYAFNHRPGSTPTNIVNSWFAEDEKKK